MRHFRPPIHAAIVAVTLVAGLASYQGVDKLVLARGGHQYGTANEAGHEPASSTTTVHHEPGSTTTTTVLHETAPSTSPTTAAPKPPTPPTVQTLTLKCGTVMLADGRGAASCGWSESTAPNFHLYLLTRELVGTPRQTVFTTEDRSKHSWGDIGLAQGSEYSYIIEAYDADGHLIGRGGPVHVTCCNGAVVTA